MAVEHGFIVLGDVSGYGEFIAKTELDHSREILAELLSTLCECAPGRLSVAQLEGDAVLAADGDPLRDPDGFANRAASGMGADRRPEVAGERSPHGSSKGRSGSPRGGLQGLGAKITQLFQV